ncbi:MAG: hypothetical protein N2440_06465 [Actinobacteria bacterium]|nr:hypothetical protein [Actinomycetota bacterium]
MNKLTQKELKKLKLECMKKDHLMQLAKDSGIDSRGSSSELIEKLIDISMDLIDGFMKKRYLDLIKERQEKIISDEELKQELLKVKNYKWGTVQGGLDQMIQSQYVRKFARYDELINEVRNRFQEEIKSYLIATWYNHWTTVLIEDHISQHPRVIPTLKHKLGIDIFFDDYPFDLKITYLRKDHSLNRNLKNPKEIIKWLYENQGEQRFSPNNRIYILLLDKKNVEESWKLKSDFDFLFNEIDNFFDSAKVTEEDQVTFSFKNREYTSLAKLLFISKG